MPIHMKQGASFVEPPLADISVRHSAQRKEPDQVFVKQSGDWTPLYGTSIVVFDTVSSPVTL